MSSKTLQTQDDLSNKNYLYLTTTSIQKGHRTHSFKQDRININLSYEPNDFFVKCTYTNVSDIHGIVYFVNKQKKVFEKFYTDANKRKIVEITVYYLRYNETPLYLSVMLFPLDNPGYDYHLNYKLSTNGEWEKANHHFYLFGELKSQALKFDMLQFFEIEKFDTDYPRDRIGPSHPHIDVSKNRTGEFKFYKHMMQKGVEITKFFSYRNRILTDIVITDKHFYEIDVVYYFDDRKNTLPLMIIVHISKTEREYFINKGGNYKWEKDKSKDEYFGNEDKLAERLTKLREELMGEVIYLDLEYIPKKHIIEKYDNHEGVFCLSQNEMDLKYTSCRFYCEKGKRFSIKQFNSSRDKIDFPHLPLYSIQSFYTFHNISYEIPILLCAVYETHHNEIYDWYELVDRKSSKYQKSYLLSGDPAKFKNYFDVIRVYETNLFQLDFEIPLSLPTKDSGSYRPVVAIDEHDFDKDIRKFESNHTRYVLTPTYGNFFTIKSLKFYGEVPLKEEFKPVKEIHVFEHANLFHYKVCIVTWDYNYNTGKEDKNYHWYEFRKETNRGNPWTNIGKLSDIKKSPDDYNTDKDIMELMNEFKVRRYGPNNEPIRVSYNPQTKFAPGLPYRPISPDNRIPTSYEGDNLDLEYGDSDKQTQSGGITPLAGGLIGSGAGVGIISVTGGYLIYTNMGAISNAFSTLMR